MQGLRQLLQRAIAPYTSLPDDHLLQAAQLARMPIDIFVDGMNECDQRRRELLVDGLLWLRTQYGARIVIASTIAESLPPSLHGKSIELPSLSRDHKRAVYRHYVGDHTDLTDEFLEQLDNAFDVQVAGEIGAHATPGGLGRLYDGFSQEHLPRGHETISRTILREFPHGNAPEHQLAPEYLDRAYAGIPFRFKDEVRQKAKKEEKNLLTGAWIIVFFVFVIPVLMEMISLGYSWLGQILSGLSIGRGYSMQQRLLDGKRPRR